MYTITKEQFDLLKPILLHFCDKCDKAIRTYEEAGIDENDRFAGKPLAYYRHAKKYIYYMIWFLDPTKKQKGKRTNHGEANSVRNDESGSSGGSAAVTWNGGE